MKDSTGESMIFGMSVRGLAFLMLTFTVCILSPFKSPMLEALKDGFFLALGFFYGQKTAQRPNKEEPTK